MCITVKSASYIIFRRDIIINQFKTASVHSTDRQSSEYDSFIQSNILLIDIIFLHNTLCASYVYIYYIHVPRELAPFFFFNNAQLFKN